MVSHVDHTEHDVMVIITEQGLADLRGLAPRQRVKLIIENCAHPDYREQLWDYYKEALSVSKGIHTPHVLSKALSWHENLLETGTMKIDKAAGAAGRPPGLRALRGGRREGRWRCRGSQEGRCSGC